MKGNKKAVHGLFVEEMGLGSKATDHQQRLCGSVSLHPNFPPLRCGKLHISANRWCQLANPIFLKTKKEDRPQKKGKRMKKLIFSCLIITLFSCAPSRYFLTTHDDLRDEISKYGKLPTKRYLITPSEYEENDLPFINSEPSKTVIANLQAGNFKKAKKALEQVEKSEDMPYVFSSALVTLFEGKYDSCEIFIRKMDKYSKNCFVMFISNDCSYEQDRLTGNVNYKKYVEKYQNLLDCASNDDLHKELVKMRLKLIRYGY
ncbi:MAG: hypothetical protein GF401_12800 [Chitinivibrionales bacterium]|nr:hypothetical protein [Chitinivibrionales bacterium]